MECLDDNTVLELLQGALPVDEAATVHAHLDGCSRCQRWVAEMTRAERPEEVPVRALQPGEVLDRYLVIGRVGAGAMGVVYAAFDPQLDRKVALKLLRTGATREAQSRLLGEAQALARLSHPGVVTVYAAGVAGEQVFMAMEFVEGTTLREWLRQKRRPWREVLSVFERAGEGLSAAHHAGLVHRDFKPDNVLMGADGRVQVTDFGLALRDGGAVERVEASNGGVTLAGTPAYMPPEQLAGRAVDARSDQFSFCVALHEALYGARPFPGDTLKQVAAAAREGRVRPASRSAQVPGWLRRVLLKGLSAEPEARFSSLDALLSAVRRGRRRQVTLWQAAAAASLLAVGTAVGTLHAGVGDPVCRGAERKLAGVWDDARKSEVRAALLSVSTPYAEDAWRSVERALDGYAEAWVDQHTDACQATRVRKEQSEALLDLRVGCLDRRLQDVRALTDFFLRSRGEAVEQAVQAAYELPPLQECASGEVLAAQVRPPGNEATRAKVEAMTQRLSEVRVLSSAGRYVEALERADAVVRDARALEHLPTRAEARALLGELRMRNGDAVAAERTLYEAVWAAQAGHHDRLAAQARIHLVRVQGFQLARSDPSDVAMQEAAAAVARVGPDLELEAELATTLGSVRALQERCEEAVRLHQRALQLAERAYRPEDPRRAWMLSNLGNALNCVGDLEGARARQAEALELRERTFGPDHPALAGSYNNMANALARKRDMSGALEFHRKALALHERSRGPESAATVIALVNVATDLNELSRSEEALPLAQRALRLWERVLGPDSPRLVAALLVLGEAQVRLGQAEEARKTLERGLALAAGREDEDVASARFALAQALRDAGREPARAEALARQARDYFARHTVRNQVQLERVEAWLRGTVRQG